MHALVVLAALVVGPYVQDVRSDGFTVVFETADEYFDYYRDYHAFWKLYGMELPDEVLKKLYYKNASRLVPSMPKAGFPR